MNKLMKIFILYSLLISNAYAMEKSSDKKPKETNFSLNPSQVFDDEITIDASKFGWEHHNLCQFKSALTTSDPKNEALLTLFRSVDPTAGLQIVPNRRALWLEAMFFNIARPYNIYANKSAADHNAGEKGNYSQYTSWTYSLSSANLFGCEIGCTIFQGTFDRENIEYSPDNFGEKEILIHGTSRKFKTYIFANTKNPFKTTYSSISENPCFIELTDKRRNIILNSLAIEDSPVRKALIRGSFKDIDFAALFSGLKKDSKFTAPMTESTKLELYQTLYAEITQDCDLFFSKLPKAVRNNSSKLDTTDSLALSDAEEVDSVMLIGSSTHRHFKEQSDDSENSSDSEQWEIGSLLDSDETIVSNGDEESKQKANSIFLDDSSDSEQWEIGSLLDFDETNVSNKDGKSKQKDASIISGDSNNSDS